MFTSSEGGAAACDFTAEATHRGLELVGGLKPAGCGHIKECIKDSTKAELNCPNCDSPQARQMWHNSVHYWGQMTLTPAWHSPLHGFIYAALYGRSHAAWHGCNAHLTFKSLRRN